MMLGKRVWEANVNEIASEMWLKSLETTSYSAVGVSVFPLTFKCRSSVYQLHKNDVKVIVHDQMSLSRYRSRVVARCKWCLGLFRAF